MLRMVALLQGQSYTADELAEAFKVHRRTVFRDIDRLKNAGIHIRHDPADDRCQLPPHFEVPGEDLNDIEMAALVYAIKVSPALASPELAAAAQRGLSRIVANSPAPTQRVAERILTASSALGNRVPACGTVLETLLVALATRRQVRVMFTEPGASEPQSTRFCPYQVSVRAEKWLVYGRSSRHRKPHAFDLSEIVAAELTTARFEPPPQTAQEPTAKGEEGQLTAEAHAPEGEIQQETDD
jgi:predicted DNA-binding transcriptional regulator YafY